MSQLLEHPTLLQQINTKYSVYGILKGFDDRGYPQLSIEHSGLRSLVSAQTICELTYENIGSTVLINFVSGDPKQIVVIGVLREPTVESANSSIFDDMPIQDVEINSGLSSIILKPTGRIEIKGVELNFEAVGNVSINGEKVLLNCDKEKEINE